MAVLQIYPYTIDSRRKISWTTAQEKALPADYPLSVLEESGDHYVARTYLQFLWLPESLMPLHLVAPSLLRLNAPSTSTDASVHPLHAFLEPLLLTSATTVDKYHVQLPQILENGGGAGEMEETMMWYAISHEREGAEKLEQSEDLWMREEWRTSYLERMERREVMIQILLYFTKLSLPGPVPVEDFPKKKKKRSAKVFPPPSFEDKLESFMDKLSMWQLVGNLEQSARMLVKTGDPRDWMQIFVEDVVERQFKDKLPELCELLHSKVFPSSPFSDPESDALTEPAPSAETVETPLPTDLSRAPSSLLPSPTHSTSSRISAVPRAKTSDPQRARSRSLSVSLAQEKEQQRAASRAPSKKPTLNREVSMSRVFKPKAKGDSIKSKPTATRTDAPMAPPKSKAPDLGVTLVEETPEKPRISQSTSFSLSQPVFGSSKERTQSMQSGITETDDDEWAMDSSPVVHTLQTPTKRRRSSQDSGSDSDADLDYSTATTTAVTPSRPTRKRKV